MRNVSPPRRWDVRVLSRVWIRRSGSDAKADPARLGVYSTVVTDWLARHRHGPVPALTPLDDDGSGRGTMAQAFFWSHEIALSARPSSVGQVRAFAKRHLVEHGFPQLVEDVQLVASELATNCIVHAQTPFSVTLSCADERVMVKVADGSARVAVQVDADLLDFGGRGLTIVSHVSQKWGVTRGPRGSKSVWASFDTALESLPRTW
jgi:anti-sigma regulatory factor (Ser/Thr protein kinase)